MKYLFLFLLCAASVAAGSIDIGGTTASFESYTIGEHTLTLERTIDATSSWLYAEATSSKGSKTVKMLGSNPFTLNDAYVASVQQSVSTDAREETVTIEFASVAQPLTEGCAQDICTYMHDTMGITEGSAASFIPFSDATINIASGKEHVGTLTIKDKTVESLSCCTLSEAATHELTVKDVKTLEDINGATNKLDELNAKLNSGDLTLNAKSFGGKISLFFKKLLLKFA